MTYNEMIAHDQEKARRRVAAIKAFEEYILERYDLPGMRAKDAATVMHDRGMDPRVEEDMLAALTAVGVKHAPAR